MHTQRTFRITKYFMRLLERVMGVEPTSYAWEAYALPLCYTRKNTIKHHRHRNIIRERYNGYKK